MKIVAFLLIISSTVCYGQRVDFSLLREAVTYLASDELEGRYPGTEGEKLAAVYIRKSLKSSGVKSKDQKIGIIVNSERMKCTNVLGFLNRNSTETIIISAHYDHLGFGMNRSLGTRNEIHNGADDNASGVAVMLWLADTLSKIETTTNILFVAYSGHEVGLQGSEKFEQLLGDRYGHIVLAINLDMVGRMDVEKTLWYDVNEALRVPELSSMESKWKRSPKERIHTLDSRWMAQNGVPSITLTTGLP